MLLQGLVSAVPIALGATGLALSRRTVGYFPFSHAGLFVSGAYGGLALSRVGAGTALVLLGGALTGALLALAIDVVCYRPLRRRGAGILEPTLVSLGVLLVLQSSVAMLFGTETEVLPWPETSAWASLSSRGSGVAALSAVAFLIALLLLSVAWIRSPWNLYVRAVEENRLLARICGVPGEATIGVTALAAGALSGVAGVLAAWHTDLSPSMGLRAFMAILAAAIIGYRAGLLGPSVAGAGLGVVVFWSTAFLPLGWRDLPVLFLFVAVIVFEESRARAGVLRWTT